MTPSKTPTIMSAEDAALMLNATKAFVENLESIFSSKGILDTPIDEIFHWAKSLESAQILSAFDHLNGPEIVHMLIQKKVVDFINSKPPLLKTTKMSITMEEPLTEDKEEDKKEDRKLICINPGPKGTELQQVRYLLCRLDSIIYHLIELQQAVAHVNLSIAKDIRDIARLTRVTRVDLLELMNEKITEEKEAGPEVEDNGHKDFPSY